jgi:hypothetical protein
MHGSMLILKLNFAYDRIYFSFLQVTTPSSQDHLGLNLFFFPNSFQALAGTAENNMVIHS